jgi:tetratricopeptide (TPR) repeat protein
MAEQAWRHSFLLEPTPSVLERLLEIHQRQDNFAAVIDDLEMLFSLKPDDQMLAYQLALHLAVLDPSASANLLEKTTFTEQELKNYANMLMRKLQAAIKAEQPEMRSLAAGQALAELGEWRLAKAAFEQALLHNPEYAEAWSFLGESRQHLDPPDDAQALAELRQGLWLKPDSVATISMLALYWQRQGNFTKAVGFYRAAAEREPQNPAWFAALGGVANAEGDLQSAEWYYQHAVDLAPREAVYWRMLAQFYIVNQIQIQEKALPAAQKAAEVEADDPNNLVTLGQALLLLDDTVNARKYFALALTIDPSFAPAYLHFGITELFSGQTEKAHQYLQKARDLAVDKATSDQANRLLSYYFP